MPEVKIPRQRFGVYKYVDGGAVCSGIINEDIRELVKKKRVKIIEEW